jgi:hypothetical protein
VRHGGAGLRTFLNIAVLWRLSDEEQMQILGIRSLATFEEWKVRVRARHAPAMPMNVIVRIGCVLSIYASLVTLLSHERSADWIHAPNKGSLFGGNSPLAMLTGGALEDLDSVARYLLGQIPGEATNLSQAGREGRANAGFDDG